MTSSWLGSPTRSPGHPSALGPGSTPGPPPGLPAPTPAAPYLLPGRLAVRDQLGRLPAVAAAALGHGVLAARAAPGMIGGRGWCGAAPRASARLGDHARICARSCPRVGRPGPPRPPLTPPPPLRRRRRQRLARPPRAPRPAPRTETSRSAGPNGPPTLLRSAARRPWASPCAQVTLPRCKPRGLSKMGIRGTPSLRRQPQPEPTQAPFLSLLRGGEGSPFSSHEEVLSLGARHRLGSWGTGHPDPWLLGPQFSSARPPETWAWGRARATQRPAAARRRPLEGPAESLGVCPFCPHN